MTYALFALTVTNAATLAALVYQGVRDQRERSALLAAALQANDLPDARRVLTQADQDARRRVADQLEASKMQVNPDGTLIPSKPIGV
jgi:hypothetical protein|tara:strand:- start:6242 stop:6502 length:261 start_codon:yes stop_codon:yes gene_type:complete